MITLHAFMLIGLQFLCEMTAAWQMCIDLRLGMFAEDAPRPDPLAKHENEDLTPKPPYVAPHQIWTKVSHFYPLFYFKLRTRNIPVACLNSSKL